MGGTGPIDARIMLVGEAPGSDENDAGRPFVGPSGRILDRLINRAGLHREDLFITNVVKYQTVKDSGNNRHPTKQEVTYSLPCLRQEILIVDPLVLALMGRTAIQAFFPMHDPTSDHGVIFKLTPTSRPVVMLYHPGVVIYSQNHGNTMQTLIDDFQVITRALKE